MLSEAANDANATTAARQQLVQVGEPEQMPEAFVAEKLQEWEESSASTNRSTKMLDEWEMA